MIARLLLPILGCIPDNNLISKDVEPEDSGQVVDTGTPCTPATWYPDGDGDGYGDAAAALSACEQPAGTVMDASDCDDADATIHPGATEACNGADDDCDGVVDEGVTTTWYADADGDGAGDAGTPAEACDAPDGFVASSDDCDDTDGSVHPGADDACDGIDDDCDGAVDAEDCECSWVPDPGLAVTIVESESYNSGHDQDLRWQEAAVALGFAPSIQPQSVLDDIGNLAGADLLVVASGVIGLNATRVSTIEAFLASGRSVYLQTEYQCTLGANPAFATIVNDMGASFSWGASVNGDRQPVTVSGCLAENANTVAPLGYFWYGCEGSGISPFLTDASGHGLGWHYCSSTPGMGALITTTDQDWLKEADVDANAGLLVENLLTALATNPMSCP